MKNIFNKKMPLLSMDKDVTVFRRFVKYEDRQDKKFPSQYIYMYPSYTLQSGQPIISYTIGCGTVGLTNRGSNHGWNNALRRSIVFSLKRCASAARANDNKKGDNDDDHDDKKKTMSFILPQFAIIVYWTEKGTDVNGMEKSANISLKMDARNFLAKDFDFKTFFVALYNEGLISQDAADKIRNAVVAGAKKLEVKVQEYLNNAATK